ncbi:MAG: efflux RND transporter periplasmic adaptor subunit [Lentisphaerae bacterium]|nr:efflux RND transporter periplasmic adaptor subunit [Lentisphaerota bacterium]
MNESKREAMAKLTIPEAQKSRRRVGPVMVLVLVAVVLLVGLGIYAATGRADRKPVPAATAGAEGPAVAVPATPPKPGDVILTVSGYVIPRERIEISPKFQGTVRTITIKKGDRVKRGDVLVELEDEEQRARLQEAQGQLALAEAALTNALANFERQQMLASRQIDSVQALDGARRDHDSAVAQLTSARGQLALAQTYLDWCTIRAPIDGTILEKLVSPNELVTPQSFGGGRGPSTAFLAMADLGDLQVEIDLSEEDTPRVHLNQRCRISPETYPDNVYQGHVAEIAPEANRSKGTLQVKVQVESPDAFLTPELTAKVDFIAE